jgi:transcriptional regulator with XRE-family HTH domain
MDVQPSQLRQTFAERVRRRRKELGLSQVDLAHRLGVTQPSVARLESMADGGPVGTDVIARVAEALETAPSALLSLDPIFSQTTS